jgi:uncharacterized membrane protein YfcA
VIAVIVLGFAAGVLSGLLGVGGGILFVPALTLVLSLSQVRAESTSLLAIVPVAILGAVRQRRYGNLELREGVLIGLLSVAGAAAGTGLANVLPQRALRFGFAALTAWVAIEFLRRFRAGRRAAR